jgi:hypothetical protein
MLLNRALRPVFASKDFPSIEFVDFVNAGFNCTFVAEEARTESFAKEFSSFFEKTPLPEEFYDLPNRCQLSTQSPLDLTPQFICLLHLSAVIGGTNQVVVETDKVIADSFGDTRNFQRHMASHGHYFGFKDGEFNLSPDMNLAVANQPNMDKLINVVSNHQSVILLSYDNNDQCLSHWIHLVCYRIYRCRTYLAKLRNPVFVSTTCLKNWQVELLRLLFPEFISIDIKTIPLPVVFDRVFIPIQTWDSWYNGCFWHYLRSIALKVGAQSRVSKRLFISRDDASSRRLSITPEFSLYLAELGFETITMTKYNVEDQIKFLSCAEFIILINGSHVNLAPFFTSARGVVAIWNKMIPQDYPHVIMNYIGNFRVVGAASIQTPTFANADLYLDRAGVGEIRDFFDSI